MNIETLTNDVIEAVDLLVKFTKTHQNANIHIDSLDELERVLSELQETTYELESRMPENDDDISNYEEV
mgnify:CR=1 FL=1